ncbi:GAF domain-containing protein [Planomonospora sp. ID67723]|uniref:ATP-binding protein n=1 Tax=Planomonospora sp. ID67723 TaxID=2738134 RepID=UPI0018C3E43C|nr:ATP-binding protein [Planomonospora sp. ID67723]MBG0830183.1 GAF domain-containing protein [Planomonospora sp. ID67723]
MVTTDRVQDAWRMRALHATGLLEAQEVPLLDRVTGLAVRLVDAPVAMVSLITRDRQVVISAAGSAGSGPVRDSSLSQSMCRQIVATDAPLVVADARADARWHAIDAVGEGRVTAYAGTPLRTDAGQVLGALCVIDPEPRQWSAEQLRLLDDLAAMVEAEIAARLARARAQAQEARMRTVLDQRADAFVCVDATATVTGWDGAAERVFGWTEAEAVGRPAGEVLVPERMRETLEEDVRRVLGRGAAAPAERLELTGADRDGREFPAELVVRAAVEHGEPVLHALLHVADGERAGEVPLQDRQVFLQALLDNLEVGVAACDSEGRIVLFNQPLREDPHLLHQPEHVCDLAPYELFAVDEQVTLDYEPTPLNCEQTPLARALAGETIDGRHYGVRTPAGLRRYLVNGRPIEAPDGRRLGAVAVVHDITEQHRAEVLRDAQHAVAKALAEAVSSRQAATGAVAAVTEALGWTCGEYWQADPDGDGITRIGSWSTPGRDVSAFTSDEEISFRPGQGLAGLAWTTGRAVWIPDLTADPRDFVRKPAALRSGLRAAIALPVRSGEKVLGVLGFYADTVQEPDDELVDLLDGVCAHVGRYTERRRAEELAMALAESRRRLDQVVAQLNDDVWSVEITAEGEARPVYLSSTEGGVVGDRVSVGSGDMIAVMADYVHPDDRKAYMDFCTTLVNGAPAQIECRFVDLQGAMRWIWIRGRPRREGARLFVDGVSTDMTDRRRMEEERERLLAREQRQVRRLRELDAMKDELMALVTHELRNPVSAIRGYAEMLADDADLTDAQQMFVDVIDRKSAHLQRLVDDLLELARLDAGHIAIDLRLVHVTRLVGQAVDDHRPAAKAKKIDVITDLPARLAVHADPVRLRQVLDNLLSNAIKYTPEGGTVTVTAASADRDGGGGGGDGVTITVADTGIGIPAEQYGQLFSRFFRASTAKEAGIKGTGLGLAITRSIVTAHGGTVTAAPRDGGGTVFTVRLPVDPPTQS